MTEAVVVEEFWGYMGRTRIRPHALERSVSMPDRMEGLPYRMAGTTWTGRSASSRSLSSRSSACLQVVTIRGEPSGLQICA